MFAGLTALTRLDLNGNGLTALPAAVFDNLTALEGLWLYDNMLTTLPAGVFDDLTALTTLNLRNNGLAALPDGVFEELNSLAHLFLNNNGLAALQDGVFEGLNSLDQLYLATNPGVPFAPTAVALPDDGTVPEVGGTVTLDGSDGGPWGTNVTYSWALTAPTDVTVSFDDAASVTTTVTIPPLEADTELVFTLTVTGRGSTHASSTGVAAGTDTATVTVIDAIAPTVTSIVRHNPSSSPTNADTLTWRVTFSEAVENVDTADFTVAGTTAGATLVRPVAGMTDVAYDVTVSGGNLASLTATVTLSFAESQDIEDAASNALSNTTPTGDDEVSYALDNTATGKPGITGTARVGQTLTATVGAIADPDGLPAPFLTDTNTTFQWVRVDSDGSSNPTDIQNATAGAYTLVAADEGKTIKVKVSFQDGGGGSEGPLTSDAYPSGGTVQADPLAHCNAGNSNELWCASLTVGTTVFDSVAYTGYASGTNAYGGLAPNTFRYRTATIGVHIFEYDAGFLYFKIEEDSGSTPDDGLLGSGIYTLEIGAGGDKKSFVSNNPGTDKTSTFSSPGLSWSSGDTVPVKLVRAPNTAPTSADSTVTATEDTDYTFLTADFPYTDTDTDAQLVSVKIVTLPATGKGTLTLSSTVITSVDLPQTVAAADLADGNLKYSPPANENGDDLASFTFRVNDGAVDSTTAHTLTIDVTAVNDAPTGQLALLGQPKSGATLTLDYSAIMDADGLPDLSQSEFTWSHSGNSQVLGSQTTYTLTQRDVGKQLDVIIGYEDDDGEKEEVELLNWPDGGVIVANNHPIVANAIQDQAATVSMAFSYVFPPNTFSDEDGDTLTYMATQADDTVLPTWLNFAADTRAFSGTPAAGDVATVSVKVTASDGYDGGTASDTFDIVVSAADSTAPTVTSIERQTPASSPTNADTLTWRVTFSEAVENVDAADFTVAGTTATAMTASAVVGEANAYDITVSGGDLVSLNATATLSFVTAHGIVDVASNALSNTTPMGANEVSYVLDNTAPTVTITGVPNPSSAAFTATFTFLEPVTGFAVGAITLGNATASNFAAMSETVYTALITPTAEAAFTVDVAANVATDAADNGNTAAVQVSSTYSIGICPRTQQVRDAILGKITGVTNCALVTDLHLAAITGTLDLLSGGVTALQPGDFDGLTALTRLQLRSNLLVALPAGVFAGLSALTRLQLGDNSLAALPAGVFAGLSALTTLELNSNSLAELPAGVFVGLSALTRLWLNSNSLA